MATNVNLWEMEHKDGKKTYEPHPGQKKILSSNARFKVVACGRRWGKTLMAVVVIFTEALKNPGGLYWYIAPSYRQAKNIAWRMFRSRIKLFPEWWQKKCVIRDKELIIELPNGSIIELKGAQEPDSLLGNGLDGVVLDEYAMDTFGDAPVWQEAIRPALSDKMGWAIFISTPRGYNHFYYLYEKASTKRSEKGEDEDWSNWDAWRMPTETNPYISKKELEEARREIGEDLYSQEYMAEFRKRSGLVYKEFDRNVHVIKPIDPADVPRDWKLEVGIDFGGSHPTAAIFVLFDDTNDIAYVVDEHYESEWSTEKHISAIKAKEDTWLQFLRQARCKRIGDSQAKQTLIDYNSRGFFVSPTPKGSGSVLEGINAVRTRLEKDLVTNRPKLFVCANCVNTIREFENYSWTGTHDESIEVDETMRLANKGKDTPMKVFDDAMDALRYVIQYHVPGGQSSVVKRSRKISNPIVGI